MAALLSLVGCVSEASATAAASPFSAAPARPREASRGVGQAAHIAFEVAAISMTETPADDPPVAPATDWPFLDHAVSSCVRDGLTKTDYLVDWYGHARESRSGPPGGPRPILRIHLPLLGPTSPSPDFVRQRDEMIAAWDVPERQSHVMDCTVRVPAMRNGRERGVGHVPYAIYLPADYLDHPDRRRALLLLASGGAGSRARWFLPPLRGDGAKPATGGLEMRQRVDAWAAAHPESPPPLVVAIDASSPAFVNGMAAFIDHELPDHLIAAYLPHQTREETPYGVEAVSSGAAITLRALRANPHLFESVGLTSLYCAKAAWDPRRDLGHPQERTALLAELAARHASGQFDLRISVGALDQYWDCNYELFRNLRNAGVLSEDAGPPEDECAERPWKPWKPTSSDPPSSPAVRHCSGQWPAFESWPDAAHHYRALLAALPTALEWNLDRLARALERRTDDALDPGMRAAAAHATTRAGP